MTTLIFCNIGNRDLILADEAPEQKRQPARQRGRRLHDRLANIRERLNLPIVLPALEHLLRQHPDGVDTCVLIGTDQPDTPLNNRPDVHGVPFRDKDTIWYAQTAAKWLKQHNISKQMGRVKAIHVHANPSLYDEAFDAYAALLRPYAGPEVDTCYVISVGGTPACNTALLLQGVRFFGDRCRTVYVPEGEKPYELQVGRQIWDVMQENTAVALLRKHDFAGAAVLLHERRTDRALLALAEYGRLRLDFDFDTAQQQLETAVSLGAGEIRNFARTIRHDLDALLNGDGPALIGEVYRNAAVCWRNGRYVDFLGRAFRFQEAILRHLLAHYYDGLDTDIRAKSDFAAYITARPHLEQFLAIQTHNGQPLTYTELNRIVFLAMVNHLLTNKVAGNPQRPLSTDALDKLATIYGLLQRIEDLGSLRNKTIIAHGFKGVSEQIVLDAYNRKDSATIHDPLADMAAVCTALGIDSTTPFDRLAAFISAQLQAAS